MGRYVISMATDGLYELDWVKCNLVVMALNYVMVMKLNLCSYIMSGMCACIGSLLKMCKLLFY